MPRLNPTTSQDPNTSSLVNALISGNERQALKALSLGADPKDEDAFRRESALMSAIRQNLTKLTEKLLPLCDLAEIDSDGWSPLTAAAEHANFSALKAIAAVDDPRVIRHANGVSALMCAAKSGSPECLRFLLPLSDLNARDCHGCGALEWAAKCRHSVSTLNILLDLGLDPNGPGDYTALMIAAERGNPAVVERLIPLSDLARREATSNPDAKPKKAVEIAAESEQWSCVDLLAAAGPAEEIPQYQELARADGESLPLCERRLAMEEANAIGSATAPGSAHKPVIKL